MNSAKDAAAPSVEYHQIDATHAGQRLDNYLIANLKGVPRSHIYRILRKGEVRINRGRRTADYRLKPGDTVRIPPLRRTMPRAAVAAADALKALEARILYEDGHLIAVDKPAGWAVHGGSGVRLGVIETLRAARPRSRFLELVHRLDRDTSGCLLIAKRRPVLLELHAQLRGGQIDKRYTALLHGSWSEHARRVDVPLEKYRLRSGERLVEVSAAGKDAATRFVVKNVFADSTLVEIKLLTGRTHQARVHASHIRHPIAGDPKYGDRDFNRQMRRLGLRRLFLHAAALGFHHPRDGEKMRIRAPLPAELSDLVQRLQYEAV
ncbi:MAG: 23S rRNA pseudouridine(955/2504/2580) synthase RluC [Acidiferrobacterales bacterium]